MAAQTAMVQVPDTHSMRMAVDSYVAQGFSVATQDANSVTMIKRKQFNVVWAVVGFFLCLLPLLIYLIVYAGESDQMVMIRVVGGMPTAIQASPDGRWWWDGQRWISFVDRLPPNVQVSPDGRYWWDGLTWREIVRPTIETNNSGYVAATDGWTTPLGPPSTPHSAAPPASQPFPAPQPPPPTV